MAKGRSRVLLFNLSLALTLMPLGAQATRPVAIVTGASRGIGASIAELLTRDYLVFAGMRNLSGSSASGRFEGSDQIIPLQLDITNDSSVDQAIQTVFNQVGRIDLLVNNAGVALYGSYENTSIQEAQEVFNINYFGFLRVTQAVLPIMRSQKFGRIIQIGSRAGFRPVPSMAVYSDSKAAILSASMSLAATVAPWNIKVSVIEPGPVSTDIDSTSPYGSRLSKSKDPYFQIFEEAKLLAPKPGSTLGNDAQSPDEIARIVAQVSCIIEPDLRYQTTVEISGQAASFAVDPTGNQAVEEVRSRLFPSQENAH